MKRITWIIIVCVIVVFISLLFVSRPSTKESLNLSVSPTAEEGNALSAPAAPSSASSANISARNDAPLPASANDPLAALRAIPQASTFVSLLQETGVASELSASGTYTFFVPTNAAFAASPLGPLSSMTAAQQKRLAEFHIVSGKMMSISSVKSGYITMLSRDELNANVFDTAQVGGATHVIAAYSAPDGIIYLIDHVLQPPVVRPYPF